MDYEKKYKEALERANEFHFDGAKHVYRKGVDEYFICFSRE